MLTAPYTGEQIAKVATFLAYQASHAVGMGVFQEKSDITEDKLWAVLAPRDNGNGTSTVYIDYGFGRMMKYSMTFDDKNIEGRSSNLSKDYQSWCVKYPTYEALIAAAVAELKKRDAIVCH